MRRVYVMSFLSFLLLLIVFPQITFAHTKLQNSSPEANTTVLKETKEIVMEFNTTVEPLSSFKMKNKDGNELKIGTTEIVENRIIGTFDESIPNGVYTVEWKIVGRDGHPIQGDFNFTVAVPDETSEPSQEQPPTLTPSEPTPSPQPVNGEENEVDHGATRQDRNQVGFWIVAGVVMVALIVIIFGTRRKK
ncbi:hypothetical protein BK120_30320 [Paenibacillus sp. FSL A5-0031]|uniref:copper resistance CopC family protein n=1 Tax=Paenibacillus sp. FSL A5-0031 TaxID=1920420 RepID=UPI00096E211B|nr:copper resistance protein CopC [Paenibacillus sp. FSL A5-0031]OME75961.1 hypothetical protein BK120_30320 [Paenibacillus sp. FSL A5-0031]